jgi:hypothetical protein
VKLSPQACKGISCDDFLFPNFNVAFSAIVYTFIWEEKCENKFGIIYKTDIVAYFKHTILAFARRS